MRVSGNVVGYRNAMEELNIFSISYNVQNMKQESRAVQDEVSQEVIHAQKSNAANMLLMRCRLGMLHASDSSTCRLPTWQGHNMRIHNSASSRQES
jgi:hypothetical protein